MHNGHCVIHTVVLYRATPTVFIADPFFPAYQHVMKRERREMYWIPLCIWPMLGAVCCHKGSAWEPTPSCSALALVEGYLHVLWCRRKPEHPVETHVNTGRTYKLHAPGPSCCEAAVLTTITVDVIAVNFEQLNKERRVITWQMTMLLFHSAMLSSGKNVCHTRSLTPVTQHCRYLFILLKSTSTNAVTVRSSRDVHFRDMYTVIKSNVTLLGLLGTMRATHTETFGYSSPVPLSV